MLDLSIIYPSCRCFGVWKRRFPVISLKIRLSLSTTQSIIIATAILHNICRQKRIEDVMPEVEIPNYDAVPMMLHEPSDSNIDERQDLINNYFGG